MPSLGRIGCQIQTPLARAGVAVALFSVMILNGCGRSNPTETAELATQAPIALTPKTNSPNTTGSALTGGVNEPELRKAVERYRLTKQRSAAAINFAGADLNGDGRPEALVLFSGTDWCVQTGCSLVVFQEEETGYRPVSHITRAQPPVLIGPEANFGWRDLMVRTGGGPAPVKTARLGFTGKGYPANALLQPEPVQDMLARSQQIIGAGPSFAASLNSQTPQSSTRYP